MNEFEYQRQRAERMRDKNLRPFYKEECSRDGDVVFLDGSSPFCKILQRTLHADTVLNRIYDGAMLAIQEKFRWGNWDDFLIETDSCTVAGHESPGWFYVTNAVDVVLYCLVHGDENGLTCFPLPWPATRDWVELHKADFGVQMVRNPINGRDLWSRNLIVPRKKICGALKFEGFGLRNGKVVEDFWGKPRMDWLSQTAPSFPPAPRTPAAAPAPVASSSVTGALHTTATQARPNE